MSIPAVTPTPAEDRGQSNSARPVRKPFYLRSRWTWPQFDPACCQECARVIPLTETGWIINETQVACAECHAIIETRRLSQEEFMRSQATAAVPAPMPQATEAQPAPMPQQSETQPAPARPPTITAQHAFHAQSPPTDWVMARGSMLRLSSHHRDVPTPPIPVRPPRAASLPTTVSEPPPVAVSPIDLSASVTSSCPPIAAESPAPPCVASLPPVVAITGTDAPAVAALLPLDTPAVVSERTASDSPPQESAATPLSLPTAPTELKGVYEKGIAKCQHDDACVDRCADEAPPCPADAPATTSPSLSENALFEAGEPPAIAPSEAVEAIVETAVASPQAMTPPPPLAVAPVEVAVFADAEAIHSFEASPDLLEQGTSVGAAPSPEAIAIAALLNEQTSLAAVPMETEAIAPLEPIESTTSEPTASPASDLPAVASGDVCSGDATAASDVVFASDAAASSPLPASNVPAPVDPPADTATPRHPSLTIARFEAPPPTSGAMELAEQARSKARKRRRPTQASPADPVEVFLDAMARSPVPTLVYDALKKSARLDTPTEEVEQMLTAADELTARWLRLNDSPAAGAA